MNILKCPADCEEGIIQGMYRYRSRDVDGAIARVQLFGSGAILNCALSAQENACRAL